MVDTSRKWIGLIWLVAIVVAYNYMHHVFMYRTPYLFDWISGIIVYVLKPTVVFGAIALASWAVGRLVVRDWAVATVLGMGIIGVAVWMLVIGGRLCFQTVAIPVILLACMGATRVLTDWRVPQFGRGFDSLRLQWPWYDKAMLAIIIWWIARTYLLVFNPTIGFDACHAHLWQTKNYILAGGYVHSPYHTNLALAHCLTIIQQYLWCPDPGATLQYFGAMMSSVFLYRIGARLGGRTVGLLAALLFLIQPWAYFTYMQWFSGPVMLMFLMAGIWCVAYTQHWWVAGVLLGFALAAKITCAPLVIILVVLSGRHWWKVLLLALLASSPWWLVNIWDWGNPIYPFKEQWFTWITIGQAPIAETVDHARPVLPPDWFSWRGHWTNWWYSSNPIAIPGEMTLAGPWCLALTAPLLLTIRQWTKRIWILVGIIVLLYCYWWLVEGIWHPRYMLYTFALWTLAGSWGVVKMMEGKKCAG